MASSPADSSFSNVDILVYTEGEVLRCGLRLAKFTSQRIKRAKKMTNCTRFAELFGVSATIATQVFHDLQTTVFDDARLERIEADLEFYLMTLYFLKNYPKESQIEALFDYSRKWARSMIWFYAKKIQALKQERIVWPDFSDSEVWVLSVDGVHCWIEEPEHPTWSRDTTFFSHKYNKAGIGYELGLHLWESRLIWMNGPHKAGKPDVWIFEKKGLHKKLGEIGKKAIGDLGYRGHQQHVSVPNPYDREQVKMFKSRACMRHETFNGMIKEFDCLKGRFRHSTEKFAICFEAVCVLSQYKLELERPLFDILIPAVMEEADSDVVVDVPPADEVSDGGIDSDSKMSSDDE